MRVKNLIIIMLDSGDLEVTADARSLYSRYRTRGDFRPEDIALVCFDATREEYKKGRLSTTDDKTLFGCLNLSRCVPGTTVSGLLDSIRSMMVSNESVGVYVIGHGNGEYMYSNTRPIHIAVIFHKLGITRIDKLVIFACKLAEAGRVKFGLKFLSFVEVLCYILAKTGPSTKSIPKAERDTIAEYKGPAMHPKIAGWDAIVSTYNANAGPQYTPAAHSAQDSGRKVIAGNGAGTWASESPGGKYAFQISAKGALQPLDAVNWSDKPAAING